jgi:hypothetical protein
MRASGEQGWNGATPWNPPRQTAGAAPGYLGGRKRRAHPKGWQGSESRQGGASDERSSRRRLVLARSGSAGGAGWSVVMGDRSGRGAGMANLRRPPTGDHLAGVANRIPFSHMPDREDAAFA